MSSQTNVPRWVHAWAGGTVALTAAMLALGSVVTSFRVGMSDPVWPTEPWYLFVNGFTEPRQGFLLEHTHRLLGFMVGAVVSVLALGLWWTERRPWARRIGLLGLVALIGAFGQFHGLMMKQRDLASPIVWPMEPIASMAGALALVVGIGLSGVAQRVGGSGLRLLGVAALVGVMIQGLLGGLRVRLDAILGTDLAAIHGIFAQVVFASLVVVALLTARRRDPFRMPDDEKRPLTGWAFALLACVFLQLVWGAMVRHHGTSVMQRLHLLTAFAVVGVAVGFVRLAADGASWRRVGFASKLLIAAIGFQVLLGVEAWMGKFNLTLTPDLDPVTTGKALVRCLHVITGTAVMALSVSLCVSVRQRSANPVGSDV